jgi:hypothetical protein
LATVGRAWRHFQTDVIFLAASVPQVNFISYDDAQRNGLEVNSPGNSIAAGAHIHMLADIVAAGVYIHTPD